MSIVSLSDYIWVSEFRTAMELDKQIDDKSMYSIVFKKQGSNCISVQSQTPCVPLLPSALGSVWPWECRTPSDPTPHPRPGPLPSSYPGAHCPGARLIRAWMHSASGSGRWSCLCWAPSAAGTPCRAPESAPPRRVSSPSTAGSPETVRRSSYLSPNWKYPARSWWISKIWE